MEAKIKLFPNGEPMEDGTQRLQSQLYIGRMASDFTLKDGVLKVWNGKDFAETNRPYKIVNTILEMKNQQL